MKKFLCFMILLSFCSAPPAYSGTDGRNFVNYAINYVKTGAPLGQFGNVSTTGYTAKIVQIGYYNGRYDFSHAGWLLHRADSYSCGDSAGFYFAQQSADHEREISYWVIGLWDECNDVDSDRDGVNDPDDHCGETIRKNDGQWYYPLEADQDGDLSFPEEMNSRVADQDGDNAGCVDYHLENFYEGFAIEGYTDCDGDGIVETLTILMYPIGGAEPTRHYVGDGCGDGVSPVNSYIAINPTIKPISDLNTSVDQLILGLSAENELNADVDTNLTAFFDDFGVSSDHKTFYSDYTGDDWDYSEFYEPLTDPGEVTVTGTWSEGDYYRGLIQQGNNLGNLTAQGFNAVTDGLGGVIDGLGRIEGALADGSGSVSDAITVDVSGVEDGLDTLHADLSGDTGGVSGDDPEPFTYDDSGLETGLQSYMDQVEALPALDFFSDSGISLSGATSQITFTFGERSETLDFSQWESSWDHIGTVLLGITTLVWGMWVFKRE